MLTHLSISNIVLIDRLELDFGPGLSVLTGETGAGKSILLDALALALGARSDTGLIRSGCENASVAAEFSVGVEIFPPLTELEIEHDGTLILRRTLSVDGKSRAWINDIPVSIKTLKQIGDELIEIHGQFENHTLLDAATHINSLDEFGQYPELLLSTAGAYRELYTAEKKLKELKSLIEKSAAERDYLEHNVRELEALKPMPGEEEELAGRRAQMMDAEKNASILDEARKALARGGREISEELFGAAHILERIKTDPNPYQSRIDKLYDVGAAIAEIADAIAPVALETADLESTEERLFALRAAARKHRVPADELADKLSQMQEQLSVIEDSASALKKVESELKLRRAEFDAAASKMTDARKSAAKKLRGAILAELPDLKLDGADFDVQIESGTPSVTGIDDIVFLIKTNPGTPFAPLHKIASGGELARFMLALRVVLSHGNNSRAMIFDEVDTGISGATAAAVGMRLARLADGAQLIVITHSAQVAGHADKHFLIKKSSDKNTTTTDVAEIKGEMRINELARIISGAKITPDSISAAKELIKK
ncbi:MAG: DNA repair protein RecN [Alphaproteobacteria bacterium]|nr:DNA repair protein RecN [Alphaproteobacteria bacterium]MCL2890196.1 DNA repair protein RecN [Alphaproteobacteria bacterium]